MRPLKKLKWTIFREIVKGKWKADQMQDSERVQKLMFQTGDLALQTRNISLMEDTINMIRMHNRGLLARARKAKQEGRTKDAELLKLAVRKGSETIQNFKNEIKLEQARLN